MPLETRNGKTHTMNDATDDVAFAADAKGQPMIETEALALFLEDIDYGQLFDDPELRECVVEERMFLVPIVAVDEADEDSVGLVLPMTQAELDEHNATHNTKYGPKHGRVYRELAIEEGEDEDGDATLEHWVEDEPEKKYNDEDGILIATMERIDGDVAAELIDEDDLMGLLEFHVNTELDCESMVEKVTLSLFADHLWEDDDVRLDEYGMLDEAGRRKPFKRGDFRRGVFKGAKPKSKIWNQRARMMMAMLRKGEIKRVKKGKGYRGGDYQKTGGYGAGGKAHKGPYGAGGPQIYRKLSGRNFRRAGEIRKMVDPGRKKVVQVIYKNLKAPMPKNWIPPERRVAAGRSRAARTLKKMRAKAGKGASMKKTVVKKIGVKKGSEKSKAMLKAKMLFKAKGGKLGGKTAKKLSASVMGSPANLTESATRTASVLGGMHTTSKAGV